MLRGTKRKIPIEKRNTKEQRSVAFSKRRIGVFKKTAEVSLLSGCKIAVYATSPSGNPDSIHSYASNSTALEIAQCYLRGTVPPSKPKLGFWWEDPNLDHCEDPATLQFLIDRLEKSKKDALAAFEKKGFN